MLTILLWVGIGVGIGVLAAAATLAWFAIKHLRPKF